MAMNQSELRTDFDALLNLVTGAEAQTATVNQMERSLLRQLLRMGRKLLQVFLAHRAEAESHAPQRGWQRQKFLYHSQKAVDYLSVFGKLEVNRAYFYAPGSGGKTPLDLASFASIRQCAAAFQAKGYPLHVLINNAGGAFKGKQASFTADGFEMTFGTNHLGHFLLTHLLLDNLKRSAPARVITVSSQRHIPGYGGGPGAKFDYANLKGEKFYNASVFYCNSKLANMWFAYELQRRLAGTGVTSNAVCPGFVPEAIGDRRTSLFDRWLYRQFLPRMPFARSLDQASASYLLAATDARWEGVGGKFIVDGAERRSSEESYDEAQARRLWEMSWLWCGLDTLAAPDQEAQHA